VFDNFHVIGSANIPRRNCLDANWSQIERIEGVMIGEESTAFAMYENNELDIQGLPLQEIDCDGETMADTQLCAAGRPTVLYLEH
jgi:hypothetical protein